MTAIREELSAAWETVRRAGSALASVRRYIREALQHRGAPAVVLGVAVAVYIGFFGVMTWLQHARFGTFGFDLGLHDQPIWLLSRFREPFSTIRGINYFGHHANFIVLVFVPFYWLGAGAHFLLLVQTVWMAAGAVPLYLLGRDRLGGPWLGVALGCAFLLNPSLEWINWWHFHPDALVITPLLFAWWLALRRQWGWTAFTLTVAVACKEDAALAAIGFGVIVAFRISRRAGAAIVAAGVAWFAAATQALLPLASGGGQPFYGELFPALGGSFGEATFNAVRHPSRVLEPALEHDRLVYYWKQLAPAGLLALAALPMLLIAAPQLAVNVASGHTYTYDIKYQYSAIVIAGVFIATVEGVRWVAGTRKDVASFLVGVVLASAVAANAVWSPSRLSGEYDVAWSDESPRQEVMRAALRRVPSDAGVSATYLFAPHLTHRVTIYEFPNPWTVSYWLRNDRPPQPDKVQYIVVDRRLLNETADLFARLTAPGGEFRVVFDREDVVVARRI